MNPSNLSLRQKSRGTVMKTIAYGARDPNYIVDLTLSNRLSVPPSCGTDKHLGYIPCIPSLASQTLTRKRGSGDTAIVELCRMSPVLGGHVMITLRNLA